MLNGIDPLLVITLKVKPVVPDIFGPPMPPGFLDALLDAVGVPIPIYLTERNPFGPSANVGGGTSVGLTGLTGIIVDSESFSADTRTETDGTTDLDPRDPGARRVEVKQTVLDAQLTINLVASRESVIVTALTALMQVILKRLVSAEYEIHYLNGPTAIFGALLHRFATNVARNEDLIRMELVLSTVKEKAPGATKVVAATESISATQGAIPL